MWSGSEAKRNVSNSSWKTGSLLSHQSKAACSFRRMRRTVVLFHSLLGRTHMPRRHASYTVAPDAECIDYQVFPSEQTSRTNTAFPSVFQLCVLCSACLSLSCKLGDGQSCPGIFFPQYLAQYIHKKRLYTHYNYLLSGMMALQK